MSSRLNNICRTCMCVGSEDDKCCDASNVETKTSSTQQMVLLNSIHKDIQDSASLMEILRATVPQLKLETSTKLPNIICMQCLTKLKEMHNFQRNCLETEQKLYKMLEMIDGKERPSSDTEGNDCDKLIKSDIDDVFIDENSFQFDQFIDGDDTKDGLEPIQDMDDFIESCSDLSIDFVLDDNNDDNFNASQHVQAIKTQNISNQETSDREMFPCDKCKRILKSEMSFKKHMEMHTKKDAGDLRFECHICDRAFWQRYMLRRHLRTHSGEKPFLCSECGKGFRTSSCLTQHFRRHQSEKLFSCPDCPRTFPTKADLSSHYDVHKAKPRKHICDVCGRGFSKAFVLKNHRMTHTSERPYPCEFCEKRFLTNEKLQRHTRTHTGEKPYKCTYCEMAYSQFSELTKHLRCHLGENVYQCRLCVKRYPTAKLVKEHFAEHKQDDEETRARNLAELNAMKKKGIFCK